MTRRLVVAGSGEHARVVAEAAAAAGWELAGWIGPATSASEVGRTGTLPHLGTDDQAAGLLAGMAPSERPSIVLGFGGSPAARRAVSERLETVAEWATVVHPAAWVSPSAILEPGVVILAGAIVNSGAIVAAHAIVNSGVIVEHDVHLGRHAHLAPGVVVGGGASIGDEAFVGLGATIRDHVNIGAGAVVGMGAAVVGDVPARTQVTGVPARPEQTAGVASDD